VMTSERRSLAVKSSTTALVERKEPPKTSNLSNQAAHKRLEKFLNNETLSSQIPADIFTLLNTLQAELPNKEYEVS